MGGEGRCTGMGSSPRIRVEGVKRREISFEELTNVHFLLGKEERRAKRERAAKKKDTKKQRGDKRE
jgi:hypothetical protein